jgi:hypothetical protein
MSKKLRNILIALAVIIGIIGTALSCNANENWEEIHAGTISRIELTSVETIVVFSDNYTARISNSNYNTLLAQNDTRDSINAGATLDKCYTLYRAPLGDVCESCPYYYILRPCWMGKY